MDKKTKNLLQELIDKQQAELQDFAKANLEDGMFLEVHLSSSERGYTAPEKLKKLHYPSAYRRSKPELIARSERDPSPLMDNGGGNILWFMLTITHPFSWIKSEEFPDRTEWYEVDRAVKILP